MAYTEYSPYRIRTAIRSRGLTANDVAKRSRGALSPNSIRNMEQGTYKRLQQEKLETLARVLYLPLEDLR